MCACMRVHVWVGRQITDSICMWGGSFLNCTGGIFLFLFLLLLLYYSLNLPEVGGRNVAVQSSRVRASSSPLQPTYLLDTIA